MARLSQVDRLLVYEDDDISNDPKKVLIDYSLEVSKTLTSYERHDIIKTGAFSYSVPVPSSRVFLSILCDDSIVVRLNGEVDSNLVVSPSVVGVKDGFLYKRGAFTSLDIVYTGSNTVKITIFTGV